MYDESNQTTFLSSPGFTIGAADITQASVHGGALPTKEIILAVGVEVTGVTSKGKELTGRISKIRYFGAAKLYYIEESSGKNVRIHEVKPVADTGGPERTGELPKSTFQKMEPSYGAIGEQLKSMLSFEQFVEYININKD